MCSDSEKKKYHRHYSTASLRRLQKGWGTYMCPICKKPERVTVPANETRRVVVADSTMYRIWGGCTRPAPSTLTLTRLWVGQCKI